MKTLSPYVAVVFLLIAEASALQAAYSESPQAAPKVELVNQVCPPSGIRVAVFSNGNIQINGALVNLPQVSSVLRTAAPRAKEVCVHRENPDAPEPHPNMLKVLDAIIELKLPVAFYWDAEFQKRVAFK